MSDNRKIVHDVRGKLTPVKHLIWAVKTQYDDDLSDDTGDKTHRFIQDNIEKWAKDADEYLDKVLELLEQIE